MKTYFQMSTRLFARMLGAQIVLELLLFNHGCSVLGPSVVRHDRTAYNLSAVESSNDQLLLNMLRLRDGEGIFMLELTSILSQFKFDASANFGGWWNNINRINNNAVNAYYHLDTFATQQSNWGVSADYMESPTISYAPLQGEQFAQRFMESIPIPTLLALAESGWRIDRVFDCCVQRTNDLNNAPVGDIRETDAIDTTGFQEFTRLLAMRPPVAHFDIEAVSKNIYLTRNSNASTSDTAWKRMSDLLGCSPSLERIKVIEGDVRGGKDELAIKTRPLLAVMQGLASEGVSACQQSDDKKSATSDHQTNPWLQIRSCATPDMDPYVQVWRAGRWYSISNSDLRSKRTFAMVAYLSSLRASNIGVSSPLVTVPSR